MLKKDRKKVSKQKRIDNTEMAGTFSLTEEESQKVKTLLDVQRFILKLSTLLIIGNIVGILIYMIDGFMNHTKIDPFVILIQVFTIFLLLLATERSKNLTDTFFQYLIEKNSFSFCSSMNAGESFTILIPLENYDFSSPDEAISRVEKAIHEIHTEKYKTKIYPKILSTEQLEDIRDKLEVMNDIWFSDHVIATTQGIKHTEDVSKGMIVIFLQANQNVTVEETLEFRNEIMKGCTNV